MRYGKFSIQRDLIYEGSNALLMLRDVLVTRAESIFHLDAIEYIGISKHFEDVELGAVIPRYFAEIDELYKTVTWIKDE